MPIARTHGATGVVWGTRLAGAALCLVVAALHVIDQGGFPGSKNPGYVAGGYYALELAGLVAAAALVTGAPRAGWFLSTGVAGGPFIGYVLSRGPGLPDYTSDVGNWTEPLGLVSLAVEAALFALAATLLIRRARSRRHEADPVPVASLPALAALARDATQPDSASRRR
jgi:hypothetical protein